jgi:tRNA (guanine10-N2)-dimethyltransferase
MFGRLVKEDNNVETIFFLVSGENQTLPFSEVKAILEAEGFAYEVLKSFPQVLRVHSDSNCIEAVQRRASMMRICGVEAFNCQAEMKEINRNVEEADVASYIGENESFVVRVKRIRGISSDINTETLEKELGEKLLGKVKGIKVNLKFPQKTFIGLLSGDSFIFGLMKAEIRAKGFIKRGSKGKVFTHSAEMPPKLSRCMVNLAQPRSGDVVLDPFCGTGSFLLEANLIGCRVLGFDVLRSMVRGSLRNLFIFNACSEGLMVADAQSLPLRDGTVDCIVTDPPYGISATTLGLGRREVFEGFLSAAAKLVKKGRRICVAAPETVQVKEIGERLGFKHVESHFIYIHRSLTREIAVFQLPW